MLKKTIVAGGSALLLMTLLFGRDVASYVQTTVGWVHDSIRQQVPVDFELKRARDMIVDLKPEVRRNMHLIAKEEIEVERLAQQVARLETRQQKGREALMKTQAQLSSGKDYLRCGATVYTAKEANKLVADRFQRYKTDDQTLENLHKLLAARQRGLEAARKKLEGMLAAKQQLLAEVASLEARQKMNEVAQTTSDFSFDDSHLARTRELLRDIETRIQVGERMVQADLDFDRDVLLEDEVETNDVVDEIARYFSAEPSVDAIAELSVDSQL